MKKRIFAGILIMTSGGIILTLVLVSLITYYGYFTEMKSDIKCENYLVMIALESDSDFLNKISLPDKNSRITLIDIDGTVLYDNRKTSASMNNHITRPEIAEAISNGVGESTRVSDTFGGTTYYYAVKLSDGKILRVSDTSANAMSAVLGSLPLLFPIAIFLGFIAVSIAKCLTRSIVAPVNDINLNDPLTNEIYDEFAPLLRKINMQNNEIKHEIHKFQKQQKEFRSVTEHMNEGLIVLGENGKVLSVNKSALKIFGCKEINIVGENYLSISRDENFADLIKCVLHGKAVEKTIEMFGRNFQIIAAPTLNENEDDLSKKSISGVVLLILDITEKYHSEQQRREFSANVSHELKTPLTSISGYAEIIENGIAKKEDIPRFANMIHSESKRLLALIEDIIKLSHLDEKNILVPAEDVNLYDLCDEVIKRLQSKANLNEITLHLSGTNLIVHGVRHVLFEMVYNLCDNGIKYNKFGGEVAISIIKGEFTKKLIVSDTGIGIPKEHQMRIFERFYRVDKSHSKETGGTGLGLSIVKNAAAFHGAKIDLKSTEGNGSIFCVEF